MLLVAACRATRQSSWSVPAGPVSSPWPAWLPAKGTDVVFLALLSLHFSYGVIFFHRRSTDKSVERT